MKYENSWRCLIKPPSLPPGLGPRAGRGGRAWERPGNPPAPVPLIPRASYFCCQPLSLGRTRGRMASLRTWASLEHPEVARQFLFESNGWLSTHVRPGAGRQPSDHVSLTHFWKEMADQISRAARLWGHPDLCWERCSAKLSVRDPGAPSSHPHSTGEAAMTSFLVDKFLQPNKQRNARAWLSPTMSQQARALMWKCAQRG